MNQRLFFPATVRNREPILKVLSDFLPETGVVLEVASGSGEHAVQFQKQFPNILWQSSDRNINHLKSITAWIEFENLKEKMPEPFNLNVENKPWQLPKKIVTPFSAIVCINLLHVSPWRCTKILFQESRRHLYENSPIIIYGPFKRNGDHTSNSNKDFDKILRRENMEWGIRNLEDVKEQALYNGFNEVAIIEMPANNLSIILKKIFNVQ